MTIAAEYIYLDILKRNSEFLFHSEYISVVFALV